MSIIIPVIKCFFFKKRNKKCNTVFLKMPQVGPYMQYITRNAIVSSFKNR